MPARPTVRIVGAVHWVCAMLMAVKTDLGGSIMIAIMDADQSTTAGSGPQIGC